jgi:NAD-dependent deacetylase
MERKKILILTGAGISAESGLKTFRDGDGLWENHRIEDVATPEAWQKKPELVLRFYNQRRIDCAMAQPNIAHKSLVTLELEHDVIIVTQNIDDLHERAGSSNIIHLHGEITKMRSELDDEKLYPYERDILIGDKAIDGGQFRPHVVWFGEAVPNIDSAFELVNRWAEVIVLIGSSLAVYPAAGLLQYAPSRIPKYILDKNIPDVANLSNCIRIEKPATEAVLDLIHFFQ